MVRLPAGAESRFTPAACATRWCSKAMARVPRERFVPANVAAIAYDDRPLPIAAGQTISQPYIVAFMIEALALKGARRCSRSARAPGYAAAVLAEIAAEVVYHRAPRPAGRRQPRHSRIRAIDNVTVIHGDGTRGWDGSSALRRHPGLGRRRRKCPSP
jgi:protein-L-isoaspartate O-methyltransferase